MIWMPRSLAAGITNSAFLTGQTIVSTAAYAGW